MIERRRKRRTVTKSQIQLFRKKKERKEFELREDEKEFGT
jgi:hypothetical protein